MRGSRASTPRWRARRCGGTNSSSSISPGANRDPTVFADPHRFDIDPRQRGQAPVVLRRQALLPRCGTGPGRGRGRVADVLRALSPTRGLAGAGSRRDTRVLRGWSSLPIALGEATRSGTVRERGLSHRARSTKTEAFGELIRGADPTTPVPTCPGLDAQAAVPTRRPRQPVVARRSSPIGAPSRSIPREVRDGKPPDDPDAAIDWLNGGAQAILDAVDAVGADTRVWTFIGPRPARWWIRRRVHEATVHRADAALALGADLPAVARAGRRRHQRMDRTRRRRRPTRDSPPLDRGQTLHLHATDDGLGPTGEWTITSDDDGLITGRTTTARARPRCAEARRICCWPSSGARPRPTAGVEVFGDAAVWDGWLEPHAVLGCFGARGSTIGCTSMRGNHPGRRLGHAAVSDHHGRQQAAAAGVRQADDLLPAVHADPGRHPRHPGDHHRRRRAGFPPAAR